MTSSYLWDRTGTPETDLDRIEARVRIFADTELDPLVLPPKAPAAERRPWRGFVAAAGATLALGLGAAAWANTSPDPLEPDSVAATSLLAAASELPASTAGPDVGTTDPAQTELDVAGGVTINGRTIDELVEEACAVGDCVRIGDDIVVVGPPPPAKPPRKGKLDKAEVKRVVRAHRGDLDRCYAAGLARDPSLAGRVDLEFRVGPRGKVDSAEVIRSTLGDRAVSACIEVAAEQWTFKRKRGAPARVVYPLHFGRGVSHGTRSTSFTRREVRAVVHAHIDEVRHCYHKGLARDPDLEGRIVVKFSVDRDGRVPMAAVDSSTLPDPAVGRCIAGAVERWRFPAPAKGHAVVKYPFSFRS